MSEPIVFDSTSPRLGLPLLFAAQAQKEVYVNEAFALIDGLLHGTIEGTQASPPASPADGINWLVAASATGDWNGQDGKLACRQAGNWIFVSPCDGMRLLNRGNGQFQHYRGGWHVPAVPTGPTGGGTVDTEARASINALIAALATAGIFPSN